MTLVDATDLANRRTVAGPGFFGGVPGQQRAYQSAAVTADDVRGDFSNAAAHMAGLVGGPRAEQAVRQTFTPGCSPHPNM